ncbi:OsmC family protein [Bifidobacterium choloepi]|uniref:OsmC family peroxiredoxin n=1 Tax=Bifidobacterium choloepi TaxID=2614131 RepID=A0A6I5NGT7_9BIFI|nr:OsmC family protein [Bifidobacterium choloepi]NEG69573.1 OsmC family peroxiredoxin [Bifidobacterium choloepi]
MGNKRIWVERNKDGSWDAFSEDGAHIKFGHDRGQFTPGDLMRVALAGCGALSSQFAVESALGDGEGAKIVVDGKYDPETDSYVSFDEHIVVDATDPANGAKIDDEAAEKLSKRIQAHVKKGCTVAHTYEQPTPVRMDVEIRH